MAIPQDANQRWSLDSVSSTLTDGHHFRILCVIGDFSRECPVTVVDNSISGECVAVNSTSSPSIVAISAGSSSRRFDDR